MTLFTVGHSNRSFDELLRLLQAHGVRRLVDVRTAAGSRRHPQFMSAELARSLGQHDITYVHMKDLGGFRKPKPDSSNTGWKNESFRGYADYMATPAFQEALAHLSSLARDAPTAIMCAEAVPWRCHRSLIADALLARGTPVEHILSESKSSPHALTPFAHLEGTEVTYPPPAGNHLPAK